MASGTSLFGLHPGTRTVSKDFEIGALQDAFSDSRDYIACFKAVQTFLESLAKREINDAVLVAEEIVPIKRFLAYPVEQGLVPESWRIGKAAFTGDTEVRVNVRLYRGAGITEGEIFLVKKEAGWLISDLQLGFVLLREKHEKRTMPFVPGQYDFLLEK